MPVRRVFLLTFATILVIASQAKAANPSGASETNPPVYKTHARAVVVDVVVTKGNDEQIKGLRAKDFVVMEAVSSQTGPLPAPR